MNYTQGKKKDSISILTNRHFRWRARRPESDQIDSTAAKGKTSPQIIEE